MQVCYMCRFNATCVYMSIEDPLDFEQLCDHDIMFEHCCRMKCDPLPSKSSESMPCIANTSIGSTGAGACVAVTYAMIESDNVS